MKLLISRLKFLFLFFLFLRCAVGFTQTTESFPSGLPRKYQGEGARESAADFLARWLPPQVTGATPHFFSQSKDRTHTHYLYSLKSGNRRIVDAFVKVHTASGGGVDLATSTLLYPLQGKYIPAQSSAKRTSQIKERLWNEWKVKYPTLKGDIRTEPVVWINPVSGQPHNALDTHLLIDTPWILRHFIIDEETGKILEEKKVHREASVAANVFTVSPYGGAVTTSKTLTVNSATTLRNDYFWVRREQLSGGSSGTLQRVEVNPSLNYSGDAGFSNSVGPDEYESTCACSGGACLSACPNVCFDGVNVYYHLYGFRTRINSYLSQLGATVSWPYDALVVSGTTYNFPVLINALSPDLGTTTTNNALYIGSPCTSEGTLERCLVFLPPDDLSAASARSACNASSARFYDLSREGIVIAHEYQHYVTDQITHITFSSTSTATMADALHEGYSDYMAASYQSDLAGTSKTLVGEYALQQCSPQQRELATLRVYDDSDTSNQDSHKSGLTWASGLWKIRTVYGMQVADLLTLKSLFYLSTNPSFIEAVEALVKADEALYSGIHSEYIRTLFYSTLKFTGAVSLPANGIADLGFKGCGAVHVNSHKGVLSLFVVALWLASLIFSVRGYLRRKLG